jgi:uncharacterized protein YpmS
MNFTKEQIFMTIFNIVLIIFASILIIRYTDKNIKINIKKIEKKYNIQTIDSNELNQENTMINNELKNVPTESKFFKDIINDNNTNVNDMDSYIDPLEDANINHNDEHNDE